MAREKSRVAPIKRLAQFTAWSWSRLTEWEACPFFAKCKHGIGCEKILETAEGEQNDAMARGTTLHEAGEKYLLDRKAPLHEDLWRFKPLFEQLRKEVRPSAIRSEESGQIAFTSKWEITGWFSSNAWLRVKRDIVFDRLRPRRREVIDFKTGKVRDSNKPQLKLYLLASLIEAPAVPLAVAHYWYLDYGEVQTEQMQPREVEKEKAYWEKRVAPMLADTTFLPTPSRRCSWCYLSKSKGGPCEY